MVSIIIPCYNSEKTIQRTLHSVVQQIYKNYEVVIVDDGSTDGTKKVIYSFLKNRDIKYEYIYQKNSGPSSARNNGVSHARGEYVAFLDSDDTWHRDKLSIQMTLIEEKQLNFLGATYQYDEFNYNQKLDVMLNKFNFYQLLIKTRFSTPGVVMKKDFFIELGGFDEEMKYAEDNDLWLKASLKADLYLIIVPKLVRLHKKAYGESGLSSNMIGMYLGELYSLKKLRKQKNLKIFQYHFLVFFSTIKLFRRVFKNIFRKVLI